MFGVDSAVSVFLAKVEYSAATASIPDVELAKKALSAAIGQPQEGTIRLYHGCTEAKALRILQFGLENRSADVLCPEKHDLNPLGQDAFYVSEVFSAAASHARNRNPKAVHYVATPAVLGFDVPVMELEGLHIWSPCCFQGWQAAIYAARAIDSLQVRHQNKNFSQKELRAALACYYPHPHHQLDHDRTDTLGLDQVDHAASIVEKEMQGSDVCIGWYPARGIVKTLPNKIKRKQRFDRSVNADNFSELDRPPATRYALNRMRELALEGEDVSDDMVPTQLAFLREHALRGSSKGIALLQKSLRFLVVLPASPP